MTQRIITALVGLPILLFTIWMGGLWFLGVVIAATAIASWEFYQLADKASDARPLHWLGTLLSVLIICHASASLKAILLNIGITILPGSAIIASATVLPLVLFIIKRPSNPLNAWSTTVAGVLYVGFLTSHAVLLRDLDNGRDWLLFALLITFATDTFAFLIGRQFGRHSLAPALSPNKTWEGSIAGIISASLAALVLYFLLPLTFPLWIIVSLAAAISVAGQLGDLVESMLKRRAGISDAGRFLPGHGGVLDRLDSIVFTLPLIYYFIALFLT
jgi:phosphatidate cytidylyltransferase